MESVNYKLSNKIIEFCERNGISKEDLDKIHESESSKNKKLKDINELVFYYGIKDANSFQTTDVCIKDVVGFSSYDDKNNLYGVLNVCYSDDNGTYGIRSDDKLRLSKDKMIKDLEQSFSYEPIALNEIDGKMIVAHNGCHRTSILKLLYEAEVLKGESPIEEINQKYTIKGNVSQYDMTLTYINYLLQMMKAISYMKLDYDDRGNPTGKYEIIKDDGRTKASKDDIINLFNETLSNNADKINLDSINFYAAEIPSFKEFLKEHVLKETEYGNSRNNL